MIVNAHASGKVVLIGENPNVTVNLYAGSQAVQIDDRLFNPNLLNYNAKPALLGYNRNSNSYSAQYSNFSSW